MIKQKSYEAIINNLPIGFTTVDENGITVDFNQAAQTITGFTKEEVIGKPHNSIFHPDTSSDPCPLFTHAFEKKEPITAKEKSFRKKNGQIITLLVSVAPLYDSDGNFIGGVEIFRDVTEIKRLERERQNILAMFAHDIKNSISISVGFIKRILSGKRELLDEHLNIALNELQIVENLISDFIEFSKIEAKKNQLSKEEVNLCELIKEQIESLSLKAKEKNINVQFFKDKSTYLIQTDINLLKRALLNILDNAIKYNKPEGLIKISLKETDRLMYIEVEDTGIGIPEDKLSLIFDAFYRISKDNKGSGLGLSIAKKIIETLGGNILVRSQLGKGSCFSLILPK
ncbi:MAG: PAS domain S-box protein [Thermodesulfovibrionales bacterium]|nr:PAS domain S-box protein [Thermodesulfovibrionales bacterium]